jgi:hypothetical protein
MHRACNVTADDCDHVGLLVDGQEVSSAFAAQPICERTFFGGIDGATAKNEDPEGRHRATSAHASHTKAALQPRSSQPPAKAPQREQSSGVCTPIGGNMVSASARAAAWLAGVAA